MIWKKIIVKLRMWYADVRGHHGKQWDYEPSEWYMGKHNKRKNNMNGKEELKKYLVMRLYAGSKDFYQERAFSNRNHADKYAELMKEQEPNYTYFLFEQSKDYQLEEKEINELIEDEIIKEQEVING